MRRSYQTTDLMQLLGLKDGEAAKQLIQSGASKLGLEGKSSWTFDDVVEILNCIAAEPGLSRVFARCAIARLYAGRTKSLTA